jgi:hypothetical protein
MHPLSQKHLQLGRRWIHEYLWSFLSIVSVTCFGKFSDQVQAHNNNLTLLGLEKNGMIIVVDLIVLWIDLQFSIFVFIDHFGISDFGECVLLGSTTGTQEARSVAVVVCGMGLPLWLFLRDCTQRVFACTVAGYLHPLGHWWSSRKWLHSYSSTGMSSTTHAHDHVNRLIPNLEHSPVHCAC